jgi:hypothetical protein
MIKKGDENILDWPDFNGLIFKICNLGYEFYWV